MERLDFEGRKAFVREIDCDYYTTAITYTKVTPIDTFETDSRGVRAAAFVHGEVHVVSRVVGFKKIKFYTNENVGSGELDLPEQQMHTTAYWLTVPASVMALLPYAADDRRDGVVGLAFALKQVAQLLLMCDGHDIGISISGLGDRESGFGQERLVASPESRVTDPDSVKIFVYDNYPGGIGFSAPLFQMHDELLASTRRLIAECQCENGCPGCVGPIGNTGPLAKAAALRILRPRARAQGHKGHRGTRRSRAWRRKRFELSGRSHPRDRHTPARRSTVPRLIRPYPAAPAHPAHPPRSLDARRVTGAATASSSTPLGAVGAATGESGSATLAAAPRGGVSEAPLFTGGAPARPPFMFFDLETTGLSGGAGRMRFSSAAAGSTPTARS